MYVRFSHRFHSVTFSYLSFRRCGFQLVYIRFSHKFHSAASLLIVPKMWISVGVRKVFARIPFRSFLTYHSENVDFSWCTQGFRTNSIPQLPYLSFRKYGFQLVYIRFSHTFHSATFLLIIPKIWISAGVRKDYSQIPFRSFLTYHSENIDFWWCT